MKVSTRVNTCLKKTHLKFFLDLSQEIVNGICNKQFGFFENVDDAPRFSVHRCAKNFLLYCQIGNNALQRTCLSENDSAACLKVNNVHYNNTIYPSTQSIKDSLLLSLCLSCEILSEPGLSDFVTS